MSVLDDLTALFEKQVGVKEKPNNDVIYNDHYYGGHVNGSNYPWCAAFIWDVFRMAGQSQLFLDGGKSAYCPYIENWAKQHNQWISAPPYRAGDLVLFDWDNDGTADHIGFVVSWNKNTGTTIEGNAGDMVQRLTRYADHVKGAYRPSYPDNGAADPTPTPDPAPSDPSPSSTTYTVKDGDNLWAIAVKFYGRGNGLRYQDIMRANGLTSSRIYVGQVLTIPSDAPIPQPVDTVTVQMTLPRSVYQKLVSLTTEKGVSISDYIGGLIK